MSNYLNLDYNRILIIHEFLEDLQKGSQNTLHIQLRSIESYGDTILRQISNLDANYLHINLNLQDATQFHAQKFVEFIENHSIQIHGIRLSNGNLFASNHFLLLDFIMGNVKSFEIESCETFNGYSLKGFRNLSKVRHFSIKNCSQIGDSGMKIISSYGELISLELINCNVSDKGILHLMNCSQLLAVSLAYCPLITASGVRFLIRRCSIVSLSLCDCTFQLEDIFLSDENIPPQDLLCKLKSLSISKCQDVSDKFLKMLAFQLEVCDLSIAECPSLTDDGLKELRTSKSLIRLDISNNQHITDVAVSEVLKESTQLRQIVATGCPLITLKSPMVYK